MALRRAWRGLSVRSFSSEADGGIFSRILPKKELDPVYIPVESSKYNTELKDEKLAQTLAKCERDDMNELLGPERIRSTVIESAVRMMADHFMMYDAMDKVLLNKRLEQEFGTIDSRSSSSSQNVPALSRMNASVLPVMGVSTKAVEENQIMAQLVGMNSELMQSVSNNSLIDEVHDQFRKRYRMQTMKGYQGYQADIEGGYSQAFPNYSRDSRNAYKHLISYLKVERPEFIRGLSHRLMVSDGLPNLDLFNSLIHQLCNHRLYRPAQIALECLLVSDLQLNPRTLSLALHIAIMTSDERLFLKLGRAVHLKGLAKKQVEIMSSMKPGGWFSHGNIDHVLRQRFYMILTHHTTQSAEKSSLEDARAVYERLAEGIKKFQLYEHMDNLLAQMMSLKMQSAKVLIINNSIAAKTNDKVRGQWNFAAISWYIKSIDGKLRAGDKAATREAEDLLFSAEKMAIELKDDATLAKIKQLNLPKPSSSGETQLPN
ncbi:hypothetical protein TRVA0_008S01618 [Trichomonascus vanleenenianus]|uniref:uncharacterized protein n=1 Tax=Trichomonascus vanleenenianus TaxID=2268995 RepID=UPI003EC9DEFB